MRDPYTPERVAQLHPRIRQEVAQLIDKAEEGFPSWMAVRVVEHYRSIDYQNKLYCQPWDKIDNDKDGKIDEKDEKVTNAPGGSSFHNYGLAIDFAILYDKNRDGKFESLSWDIKADFDRDKISDWMEVVKVFEAAGYEWGGRWKSIIDNPHLQKTFGYSYKDLLKKYKAGDFIPGTKYVHL